MGSYDASNSGFFLVTSAQVLHLGEQHPGQCSNDDKDVAMVTVSMAHLRAIKRFFERDCDQRE
jgi:hypothetical protein